MTNITIAYAFTNQYIRIGSFIINLQTKGELTLFILVKSHKPYYVETLSHLDYENFNLYVNNL